MLGAIVGDIVGSRFEFNNHRSKDFELFTNNCFFTDDTIMTLAVAKAITEVAQSTSDGVVHTRELSETNKLRNKVIKYMQQLGQYYPDAGWGARFGQWIFTDNPQPYNSFGNGAAMRVSACGFLAQTLNNALELAEIVTKVSHNHPEGIKGAKAVAGSVYLAWLYKDKHMIKKFVQNTFDYDLDFTLNEIRNTYKFNETCQNTVPQAIVAFLESTGFEDAIRNAISIGGDSDTVAAITGSIAEAYYGVPKNIKEKAESYLDSRLLKVYKYIGWY